MKYIDFLFWHYYCFCERHKKVFHYDNKWQALLFMYGSFSLILALIIGLIHTFVIALDISLLSTTEKRLYSFIISCVVYFLPLWYRYYYKEAITKNGFQVFRDKWGNFEHNTKKNLNIFLIYNVISFPLAIIFIILMGKFKSMGLLDGYRLFP